MGFRATNGRVRITIVREITRVTSAKEIARPLKKKIRGRASIALICSLEMNEHFMKKMRRMYTCKLEALKSSP